MHVRSPDIPDEPPGDEVPAANERAMTGAAGDEVSFRVPAVAIAAKFAAAAALSLATLPANQLQRLVGVLAVVATLIYAVRDLVARERLRVDAQGVVAARGYAGRRHLRWDDVKQIRVDVRSRLGARSQLLEIDAGEELFLFSRFDLGVDPDEALQMIDGVRDRQ